MDRPTHRMSKVEAASRRLSPRGGKPRPRGFTLVELLVVITIIAILLALLTPALDSAVYQAQLAACGANQKAIAFGSVAYTMDHQRAYIHRSWLQSASGGEPHRLTSANGEDARPALIPYLPMDLLTDPLSGGIDLTPQLTKPNSWVYSDYALWTGYGFVGQRGLIRLGDRLAFAGRSFEILAGCRDQIDFGSLTAWGSHPDDAQKMTHTAKQDGSNPGVESYREAIVALYATYSYWTTASRGVGRGAMDTNHATTDGAVLRYGGVAWDEWSKPRSRMTRVAAISTENETNLATRYRQIPAH